MMGAAIATVLSLALASFGSGFFAQTQVAAAEIDNSVQPFKSYPNPDLTKEQESEIINAAMNAEGVKEWSPTGWKYVSMDFLGVTEPELKWQTAIVHLQLPPGSGNPPAECFQGWWATIDVDLATYSVKQVGVPNIDSHQCQSDIKFADPDLVGAEAQFPAFVQTASAVPANPGFLLLEENDVTSYNIYGNLAYFKTPAYNTAIYNHMDYYIAELINWKSSTNMLAQEGWMITTVAGCTTCGSEAIPADSGVLVYADQSVYGNLEAHKIPGSGFNWVNGRVLLGETICNGGSNYLQSVGYGSSIWNHNTSISCSNADNNSQISNAGYFENWNTVSSSNWASDITDPVTMYSAYEGRGATNTWYTWINSSNQQKTCGGSVGSTTAVSGSLAGGGTATITPSGVPVAC